MKRALVEVLDRKVASAQCRQQVDLSLAEQIVPFTLELCVRLLLEHDDDISRDDARRLVALPVELDLLSRFHSLVDVHLEHLSLRRRLLAVTRLATVLGIHHLACTLAFVARLLDLLHHWPELAQHHFDALTATRRARLHGAFLSASALARLADDGFGQRELLDFALVEILEGDADAVDEVLAATRSCTAAASA